MGETTRTALYCRVSTDEQVERGTSLTDQLRRTETYCDERGWLVVARYRDDAVSGATLDRPALQKLLAAARKHSFDVVVVTDPDRLSRDLVDGLVVERELQRVAVQVVYLVQPTMGTLERQLRGVIAEEERRKIRDRTSRGQRAVALEGNWPGGQAPYGYRVVRDSEQHRSHLDTNDDEADILRWMISAFVDEHMSTAEIAANLNARSVPTASTARKVANRATGRWTHAQVRFLLSSCRGAAGTWTYRTSAGTITIDVPAILTEQRNAELQKRLAQTSTGKGSTTQRHTYLLTGRLSSPCGSTMHGTTKPDGSNRIYRCINSIYERGPDRCDCKRVSADALEQTVWNAVRDALTEPGRLLKLAGLAAIDKAADNDSDLHSIDRKIRRLESALGTQIAGLLAQGIDANAISHAVQQLEQDLNSLRQHRSRVIGWAASRQDKVSRAERITRLAESARAALQIPTPRLQQATIALLDIRVHVAGYQPCGQCSGRGLIPQSAEPTSRSRRHTGDICPSCLRYKKTPIVSIEGFLPDIDTLETPSPQATDQSLPLTIRPSA